MCLRGVYRSPSTQSKIIFIIHRNLFITSITFFGIQIMRFYLLAKVYNTAFRTVHYHTSLRSIQINLHLLTQTVQQFKTSLFTSRHQLQFQFKSAVVISKSVSKRFSPFTVKSSSFLESFRKCSVSFTGAALR